jgi:hypothetical protein
LGKIQGRNWLKAAAQIFSKNPLQVPENPREKTAQNIACVALARSLEFVAMSSTRHNILWKQVWISCSKSQITGAVIP